MTGSRTAARAASLGVSGIIWVGIGALFLTQAPRLMETTLVPEPPPVTVDPLEPPPPPPALEVTQRAPELPKPWTPPLNTLTERPTPPQPVPVDPAMSPPTLPPGPAPVGPATAERTVVAAPPGGISIAQTTEPVLPSFEELVVPPPAPPVIVNPVRVAGADPAFPERALEAGRSGTVTLTFAVDERGRVSNIEVLDESPRGYGFARAARAAITRWTFEPQRVDGTAVVYQARYTIRFDLDGS